MDINEESSLAFICTCIYSFIKPLPSVAALSTRRTFIINSHQCHHGYYLVSWGASPRKHRYNTPGHTGPEIRADVWEGFDAACHHLLLPAMCDVSTDLKEDLKNKEKKSEAEREREREREEEHP